MDLAAQVRAEELESVRLHLGSTSMRTKVLQHLDERGGAEELVRQQYSGRYAFELLQNADDAARMCGVHGSARFVLTDTAVLVADNGAGFAEDQVRSICSLGRSPKGPGTSIGHKGLGFKSVGEICVRPQIFSAQASFQFDARRLHRDLQDEFAMTFSSRQRLPSYAFPYPLEPNDFGDDAAVVAELREAGFSTVIRLPLREGLTKAEVSEQLVANLQPRLLLFLPSIDHLQLVGTDGDFAAEVVREDAGSAERVLLETDNEEQDWLVYRGGFTPSPAALEAMGEEWVKLKQMEFAVAVPLDNEAPTIQPLTDETFPLQVYFPTEERPGLHVAIHAEWVLTMDRKHIAATPEAVALNNETSLAVIDFVCNTVATDLVERCDGSATSVAALMPAFHRSQLEGAVGELVDAWCEKLAEVPFMPMVGGQLGRPRDVQLLPITVEDVEAAHDLAALPVETTLRADIEALEDVDRFVMDLSEHERMQEVAFLALLREPTAGTVEAFYNFVTEWARWGGVIEELVSFPCVLTTTGRFVAVADHSVFFTRQGTELPEDIDVPVAVVPDVDGAEQFLRQLGVKDFSWRHIIREYLVPILEDPDADVGERRRAMGLLRAYQPHRKSADDDSSAILHRVLVAARNADGSQSGLRPAGKVYFGREWTASPDLEEIYGPFDRVEFLAVDVPQPTEAKIERDFYRMLGVLDHPRLDHVGGPYAVTGSRHPHMKAGRVFQQWVLAVGAASCPDRHDKTQQLSDSYLLDRFEELVDAADPRRLMFLWNQLARNWSRLFEEGLTSDVNCPHAWHRGQGTRPVQSLFAYMLETQAWVPVELGGEPALVEPAQAWVETTDTPARVRHRIARISEAMYHTRGGPDLVMQMGLVDAAHPGVADLLELMNSLAAEADSAGAVSREIALAARWVQRSLENAIGADTEPLAEPAMVRLLASHDGQAVFAAQPPSAEDALLRDTWQTEWPVLSADTGSARLIEFFDLVKLDEAVETIPEPVGIRRGDHLEAVISHLNSVKPYLLALVRSEVSSAENRVLRALRNLEVLVCESLVLRYRYDGREITRDDACCYIAVRKETERGRSHKVGTAYIEFSSDAAEPDWFAVGRQLAQYLDISSSHADAITMLLKVTTADRQRMMADRQIQQQYVDEARDNLQLPGDDEQFAANVLDSLLPLGGDSAPWAALAAERAVTDEAGATSLPEESGTMVGIANDGQLASPPGRPEPAEIDFDAVTIEDATPAAVDKSAVSGERRRPIGAGASAAPPVWTEVEKRRIGKRGEEVVYKAERKRLQQSGFDPDLVVWQSKYDELAPFDLRSVDADGQLMVIEVKSTTSADPCEPFFLSSAELIEALAHGSRYYIYRVTDVDTAIPKICRWANPVELVRTGQGHLDVATARMQLGLATAEGSDLRAAETSLGKTQDT
jgi:hypothetical protein